jgi:hypothetical protein
MWQVIDDIVAWGNKLTAVPWANWFAHGAVVLAFTVLGRIFGSALIGASVGLVFYLFKERVPQRAVNWLRGRGWEPMTDDNKGDLIGPVLVWLAVFISVS